MSVAFLLISAETGSEGAVLGKLKKIDSVKEAYIVYGVYDVVAKVKANTMDKLKEAVGSLRQLDKIGSTVTMMAIEETN